MVLYPGVISGCSGYLTAYRSITKCFSVSSFSFFRHMPNIVKLAGCEEEAVVDHAATLLASGGVIALPTDTVYGLAAIARNPNAIAQLYRIKKRDSLKPIALCVGEVADVKHWGIVDALPEGLLEALLPGPVTVVLQRTISVIPHLNPGNDKVGIRVPDHNFIRKIALHLDTAIALTSANLSNTPSSLDCKEFKILWPYLAAVFDDGNLGCSTNERAGSTVIDLSVKGQFSVVRAGTALQETVQILTNYNLIKSVHIS